jgi:hypothetical protein
MNWSRRGQVRIHSLAQLCVQGIGLVLQLLLLALELLLVNGRLLQMSVSIDHRLVVQEPDSHTVFELIRFHYLNFQKIKGLIFAFSDFRKPLNLQKYSG